MAYPADSGAPRGAGKRAREAVVLVDLHCHSDCSDGYYSPAVVADLVADAGVSFASLTDHQTTSGIAAFSEAAARRDVSLITGAELHAVLNGTEIHLLAYGFDHHSRVMSQLLNKTAEARHAIEAVHEAGGIVFLAHPLQQCWSRATLEECVAELVGLGLDGIEAFYKPYSSNEQLQLAQLADRHGILTCAGSDFHGPFANESSRQDGPGVLMPVARWKRFREALGQHARNGLAADGTAAKTAPTDAGPRHPVVPQHRDATRINWRRLLLRIVTPSLLVLGLFIALLFALLIPTMEERLLDRKREMTTELTNSAWSIVSDFHRQVQDGTMELQDAQRAALERIRRLRYGSDGLDYFWITDMHPRMIMHPYRSDLEGADLSDFTDPEGVRPFVEFVNTVRNRSSGFVTYVWQWQDDPERLEAKESYVRGFAPWGWIIGTGLYVDDVRREIATVTGRLIDASFIATLFAAALMLTIAYQSLKIEKKRSEAERELRQSHERYRELVESSASGTLLLVDQRCSYANKALLDMLGYNAAELAFLDVNDILAADVNGTSAANLELIADGGEIREPFEARLRRKSGETVPILLSSTPVFFSGQRGLLLSVQDITRHRAMQSEAERERLIAQLQTSLLFLTEPVRESMSPPVSCTLDTPISQVVRLMSRNDSDVVTVLGPGENLVGIVTDHDIRERVVAAGLDPRQPVSRIMSAPVVSIHENAPIFEASLMERERNIDHLAVVDGSDTLVGVIQSSQVARPDRFSLVVLTQQVRRAGSLEELAEHHQRLPSLVESLLESGAVPRNICHVTTAVSDAVVRRIIALTLDELGPAPTRFAFVALGSEAREEQTLATDQDNALIYAPLLDRSEAVADYFFELSRRVCDGLDFVGYRHCKGEAMAMDPRWNQPLEQWKRYFTDWITEPDGKALAHCNVFFDHRCLYGDGALVRELWRHVVELVADRPAFFAHMAGNALHYKPPVGLFGKIVTGSAGELPNTFNIKEAMMPIVNFARLYALKHGIEETNTFDRLDRLHALGVLQDESYRGLCQAYGHLMQLRFRHQGEMIRSNRMPDNSVDPRSLTQIEAGTLKNTFSQISLIQKKVTFDFRSTA